ncbi:MAG: hypothetical protein NW208_06320 [Bryobacter sp.]|nr:hypothetical protein [Bryobacter sp.]
MSQPHANSFLLCFDAKAPHWQLGPLPPPHGAFALLGWTVPAPDGGVPPAVAATLAEALLALGPLACAARPHGALRLCQNPAEASTLFDSPDYPWWLQGQFALVLAPASTLSAWPASLMATTWASALPELSPVGVIGILRPGVDGAVAGILCRDEALLAAFVSSLQTAAARTGLATHTLDEASFQSALASSP